MAEGVVGLLPTAQQGVYLAIQEPLAGLLLTALLVSDDLPQVWQSLLVTLAADIIVGIGVVPVLHGTIVHRVATLFVDDVLRLIQPVQFHIALRQPRTGNAENGELCLIEATHIRERSGSLLKLSLLELRLTQEQPRLPKEGVILPAVQPFYVFLRLPAALVPLGARLDAIQFDGLLRLLNSTVEVALAQLAALLVSHHIQRNHLREVVLVAVLLLQIAFDKGLRTVEIGIIACIERMPPATACRILLRRTACQHQKHQQQMARFLAFVNDIRQFTLTPAAARRTVALLRHDRLVRTTYRKDGSNGAQGNQRDDNYQQELHENYEF